MQEARVNKHFDPRTGHSADKRIPSSPESRREGADSNPSASSRRYRNYLLAVLLIITAFKYADQFALGIALQNIKFDLHLSDVQLGFLTGLAFTAFYAIAGIPIARWADRGNRVSIVALTTALWGLMVALTGRAMSFVQLFVVRIGVGVGDAGIAPTTNSLIPDYFTRAERPRASAVYALSTPLTALVGYFVAGWVNEYLGWRTMFVLLGIPGLVLAILARMTLREPRLERIAIQRDAAVVPDTLPGYPGIRDVLQTMKAKRTYLHLLITYAVMFFYCSGAQQWQPAFLIRSFGMKTGELGTWLALLTAAGGLVSIYAGGEFASRYAAGNERLQFRVIAGVCIFIGVDQSLIYLSPNRYWALGFVGLGATVSVIGPLLWAALQTLMPPRMRATAIAVCLMSGMLIGGGLGPMAVGALSDALRPIYGLQSLRVALLILSPLCIWGAWHVWMAGQTVARDLEEDEPALGSC